MPLLSFNESNSWSWSTRRLWVGGTVVENDPEKSQQGHWGLFFLCFFQVFHFFTKTKATYSDSEKRNWGTDRWNTASLCCFWGDFALLHIDLKILETKQQASKASRQATSKERKQSKRNQKKTRQAKQAKTQNKTKSSTVSALSPYSCRLAPVFFIKFLSNRKGGAAEEATLHADWSTGKDAGPPSSVSLGVGRFDGGR